MVQVLVRGCQPSELELLDVKVELPQESGVQVRRAGQERRGGVG